MNPRRSPGQMKIIESPREAMQGLSNSIPTEQKINYLQTLLKVGFDTIEAGSFVSPKLIPQLADTKEVLDKLDLSGSRSHLMVLVVNRKGIDLASSLPLISHLSFPFSFSPGFLKKNLNSGPGEVLQVLDYLLNACVKSGKVPVIYISMAFGNPYGDPWNTDLLMTWVSKLKNMGIQHLPLSNVSIEIDSTLINRVFSLINVEFPDLETGLHLHTGKKNWYEQVDAAYQAGCRRFDTVINGLGGCPMADKTLLGNLDTGNFLQFLESKNITTPDKAIFSQAAYQASQLFSSTQVLKTEDQSYLP